MQGGKERLEDLGIKSYSLVAIDEDLFKDAFAKNVIDDAQFSLVSEFIKDPDGSMEKFVKEHPEFIQNALHSDIPLTARYSPPSYYCSLRAPSPSSSESSSPVLRMSGRISP